MMGEVFAAVDEGTPDPGGRRRAEAARAADDARSCCCSWSGRRSCCTWPRACTRPSVTASRSRATCGPWSTAKRTGFYDWTPDGETYVSDETQALLTVGDRPSTAEQVRDRAHGRAGRGDRPDAGRGRGRGADGHRPVPDPRRRLAVPPGRHHPVPGPRPASPSGSSAVGCCRRVVATLRPAEPQRPESALLTGCSSASSARAMASTA